MTEPPYSWSSPSGIPDNPGSDQPGGTPPPAAYQYTGPSWQQPGVVPLRPLALGEILDGAIKVIRQYPRPTLGLSAAIALGVTLLSVIVLLVLDQSLETAVSGRDELDPGELAAALAAALPTALITFVAGLVLTGALMTVVGRAVQGQEAPLGEVWAVVRPRLRALIGQSLLTVMAVFSPMVAGVVVAVVLGEGALVIGIPLVIAGFLASVYLYVRLALGSAALMLEKAPIITALRRSGALVKGAWWRTFWILLLTLIIALIMSLIVGIPFALISELILSAPPDSTAYQIAQQVANGLVSVLVAPFSAGVTALLYVDRRMRAEGLDVALRAAVNPGGPG